MSEHLTKNILESLQARQLSADQLMRIDDHLLACAACRDALSASLAVFGAAGRLEDALVDSNHLEYEQLEAYVEGSLPADERSDVANHLETCAECAAGLRELQDFAAAPDIAAVSTSTGWLSNLRRFFIRPVPLFAAVIALVFTGALIWLGTQRAGTPDPQETAAIAPDQTAAEPPSVADPTASNEVDVTPSPIENVTENEDLALEVEDGGMTMGISKSGELVGYSSVSPHYRNLLRSALAGGRLTVPAVDDLKGTAGVLMGDNSSTIGTIRIVSPVAKVIESDTASFRWQPSPGMESYVVDVFDENFNKVATSGELKNASWNRKLPRGRTYSWQVTAVSDGKVFKAPQRPEPEARFRIVDGKTANELSTLRRSFPRSHLLLGTAYANAGLVDEAIREFEILVKQNPKSDLPKRFLRQLKSVR